MIDHIALAVRDFKASLAFYTQALAPLGFVPSDVDHVRKSAGFGPPGDATFYIGPEATGRGPIHIAFKAATRGHVAAFHAAGLAAGGRDNGGPGIRAVYSPTYYGAFLLDPDGNNVEAVTHAGD